METLIKIRQDVYYLPLQADILHYSVHVHRHIDRDNKIKNILIDEILINH